MGRIKDFFKALAGICETKPLDLQLWRLSEGKAIVSLEQAPELLEKGGAVYLKGRGLKHPILLFRDQSGGLRAVVNRCTHGGRKLDPLPGQDGLRCCSVNHSTFDLSGKILGGPAKGPLTICPVEVKDGEIMVDLP